MPIFHFSFLISHLGRRPQKIEDNLNNLNNYFFAFAVSCFSLFRLSFCHIAAIALLLLPCMAMADIKGDQLLEQADSLYGVQQYREALQAATEALPLTKGTDSESDCLNLLAIINIRLSDYQAAARFAKECYAIDERSGDPDIMSSTLNTLAAIYLGANQPKEAEQFVLKGIALAEQADNPGRMAVLQAMASEVYHAQGDDEKALPYIERAYEIDKQLGQEPRAMVRLAQKASVLIGMHRYQEAEATLRQVIPFLRQTPDRHSLGIALNKMGMAILSQDREKEAAVCYREAAAIFQQMGDPYNEVQAQRGLYECLWKDQPDQARRSLKRFEVLKDSLYNNMSAEALAKYDAEFGNDWLQIENHEQRRAKQWAIVAAIIIGIVAASMWWLARRRRQRQARINAELSRHISELNKKYNQLSEHYDHAISSSPQRSDSSELTASDRDFLERLVETVDELIRQGQPDASRVAERMGISLYQLRQRLDSVVGEKPQDFIATIRMRRARHLLDAHPELNISEIATLCAYNDTPNFTRAFKKTFGITPTQYLDRRKEGELSDKI